MELPTTTFAWNPLDFFGLYGHRPLPPGRLSRVAVAQFTPGPDAEANLTRIEELVVEARKDGADLVVFPERAVTGFESPAAQSVPGPATDRLVALAAKHGIYIVAGLAEQDGDTLYNSAVLLGPEGLIGTHRKIHLDAGDGNWASAGDAWSVFDTRLGRIGVLVGHDAVFPESGRVLALRGCDLIACPAAIRGRFSTPHAGTKVAQNYPIPTGADPHHWHHFRARAGENNVFLAFANILDPARGYEGKSGVFGPDTFEFPRREAIVAAGEGIASIEIDTTNLDSRYPTNVVRRKDLMVMRLPLQYQQLIRGAEAL